MSKQKPTRLQGPRAARLRRPRRRPRSRRRGAMIATIRAVYERYGFEPVETPPSNTPRRSASSCPTRTGRTRACSRSRTTTSSGCRCATTSPRRSPATSPRTSTALPKPYRSYRAGWVFRNEKPGPGRFRQFMQFDADTVGAAVAGGRRRDVHDGGRHAGGARHSSAGSTWSRSTTARCSTACWRRSASAARRTPAGG